MVRNELEGDARGQILQILWGNFEAFLGFECDGKLMNDFEKEGYMI